VGISGVIPEVNNFIVLCDRSRQKYRPGFLDMYFLTFFDSTHCRSLKRIKSQASSMGFEDVFAWDEAKLEPEFIKRHNSFIHSNPRGYGYWIWKPHLISVALNAIPEGSCLLYADGGCSLNPEGRRRMVIYEFLARKGNGILAFHIRGNEHTQFGWTKMDVIERIGGDGSKPQCISGFGVFINIGPVRETVNEWCEISVDKAYHYVNDGPSINPNHETFQEHRHDQSIFSLLAYKHAAIVVPDETYWPGKWHEKKMYPVHTTRLTSTTSANFGRL
jgi:hypothetical protein